MTPEETEAADNAMVHKHLHQLTEHFDTVQIFVTRASEGDLGGTVNASYGAGNFFARYGQVSVWLERELEQQRINQRLGE